MVDDERLFPALGEDAHLYLNHSQTRKTEQANHAIKLLQINLLIASILVAAPVLFRLRGLNQFELIVVNLYTIGGVVFWLLSVGAATSAFTTARAAINPELTIFESYLRGELDDTEFRQCISASSTESKQTSGECFWLLTMSAGCAILTVYFFGLSMLDSLTGISIAFVQGLWPLLGLTLISLLPAVVVGIGERFWPDQTYLNRNLEELERLQTEDYSGRDERENSD